MIESPPASREADEIVARLSAEAAGADAADTSLRTDAAQIERLLDEVRELAPPPVWTRVEQLIRRVMALHGAGLERTLDHARAAGADTTALVDRLCADELVASLLVLHGLHPHELETRVRAALDDVSGRLGVELELIALDDGGVRVRFGGTAAPQIAAAVIRRALEEAAPELANVALEGDEPPLPPAEQLVQIRVRG